MSDGWIKLSERMPDSYPCEVTNGKTVLVWLNQYHSARVDPAVDKFVISHEQSLTHWKPLKLSEPPKPPESIAFEAWAQQLGWNVLVKTGHNLEMPTKGLEPFRSCWLAALEFAKQNKGEL